MPGLHPWSPALLLLAGCPVVFGEPPLRHGGAELAADAVLEAEGVVVRFALPDLRGDPADASLRWTSEVGTGGPVPLVEHYDALTGRGRLLVGDVVRTCDIGDRVVDVDVTVTDGAGDVVVLVASLALSARAVDNPPGNSVEDIGVVAAPALVCGRVRAQGADRYRFANDPSGRWALSLEPTDDAVRAELFLGGDRLVELLSDLDRATSPPLDLEAGRTYDLRMDAAEDAAQDWVLVVHHPPEDSAAAP